MAKMTVAVRHYFAKDSEPLRRKVHAVMAPVFALLVARGILTQDVADAVLSGAAYAFLAGCVEWARSNVMPFVRHGGAHRAGTGHRIETS